MRFPTRERVARATEDEVIGVGFSTHKAEYVLGLPEARTDLDEKPFSRDEEVKARIVASAGSAKWTADWFLAPPRTPERMAGGRPRTAQGSERVLW